MPPFACFENTVKSRILAQGLYPEKGLFWLAYVRLGLNPGGFKSGMDVLLELK